MVHLVVYTIIAGSVMMNSVAASDLYKKGSKGSNSCPKGYGHIITHAECKKAGDALDTSLHRTPIGSWSHVPPYCSYQSGFTYGKAGDRSVHFNKKRSGKNDGGYTPICKRLDRCNGLKPCFFGSDACTKEKPCSAYVGDCDSDDQCAGDLVCVITKGPQADFCQPKGTPRPRGKQPAFTKGVKECNSYEYDTGKCTACPGYWYQSCPTKTFEHYGLKMTGRGYESGQKYCGFLSCKVKCTVLTYDWGCGCNRTLPVDGWCIDEDLYEVDDSKRRRAESVATRRRAESPVLGNLLAEIEGQSDGNDEAGDDKTRVVE